MAGGISVHGVDAARGRPAEGLEVSLHRATPEGWEELARGRLGREGALDHPVVGGAGVVPGVYELRLALGAWYRAAGIDCPFLDLVPFRFVLADAAEHVHLPIKFTPWGFALFRGA
jgi:5-hydroxyisourate hydrolase